MKKSCKHHPDLSKNTTPEKTLLSSLFECCLKDEPRPLSDKLQNIRQTLHQPQWEEIQLSAETSLTVTADMIVGDLITNFPQIRPYLEDLHPLGMMSPLLAQTSLEMFFSDQTVKLETVCSDLSRIIHQTRSENE